MIALLAAVPEETRLIRAALSAPRRQRSYGLNVTVGALCGLEVALAHSGVGKAAAAAAATALLAGVEAEALLLCGCGGAYPGSGLAIGDLAIASGEIFGDEGVLTDDGFADLAAIGIAMRGDSFQRHNDWPTDVALHDWCLPLLREFAGRQEIRLGSGPFVTLSTCTGTSVAARALEQRTKGLCENMEGAAVALACRQLAVPLLEIRGISNLVEDRDTSRWDLAAGMKIAQQAVLSLLQQWPPEPP
jgi:futalosine hydrolase